MGKLIYNIYIFQKIKNIFLIMRILLKMSRYAIIPSPIVHEWLNISSRVSSLNKTRFKTKHFNSHSRPRTRVYANSAVPTFRNRTEALALSGMDIVELTGRLCFAMLFSRSRQALFGPQILFYNNPSFVKNGTGFDRNDVIGDTGPFLSHYTIAIQKKKGRTKVNQNVFSRYGT